MKLKLYTTFTLLSFLTVTGYIAQSDLDNHKKYWYYKSRFNNDFIKIGDTYPSAANNYNEGHGENIPFNERSKVNNGPYPYTSIDASDEIKAGDAVAQIGMYIATLATEYKLLKNNGQDVTTVKHEIYCALNAINRLDFYAEQALSPNLSPNLNGFFIREDIPSNFIEKNYAHFNYYNNGIVGANPNNQMADYGFTQTTPIKKGILTTDALYGTSQAYADGEEESQDQVYYLLMGITLVTKLVDVNETDNNKVFAYENANVSKLVTEAKNIADRILNYMIGNNWIIKNPNTGANVARGHNAQVYAYVLDNLGDFIKNNEPMPFFYTPLFGTGSYPHTPSGGYRNNYSGGPLASAAWQAFGLSGGAFTPDQCGFFHTLAGASNSVFESTLFLNTSVQLAISNVQNAINAVTTSMTNAANYLSSLIQSWWPAKAVNAMNDAINLIFNALATIVNGLSATISTYLQSLYPSVLINVTDSRLFFNTKNITVLYPGSCTGGNNDTPHYGGSGQYFGTYLRDILHGYNQNLPPGLQWITTPNNFTHLLLKNDVINILNSAPCQGNYNFKATTDGPANSGNNTGYPFNYPIDQWGTANFMDRPDKLWRKTICSSFLGEYSGLDYMLLHNLFYLSEGTTYPVVDYIDRKISVTLPFSGAFTTSNKSTIGAFEYIKANNIINSNGAAEYRAGKEIALLPATSGSGGFSAISGSDFNAVISPYSNCAYLSDPMSRTMNTDTTQNTIHDFDVTSVIKAPIKQSKDETNKNDVENNFENEMQNNINHQLDSINKIVEKAVAIAMQYSKFEVYPNPNNGKFTAEFNLTNEDNVSFTITDILGKTVLSEKFVTGTLKLPVDLSDVTKGVYMAKIKFSDGRTETKKITIQ